MIFFDCQLIFDCHSIIISCFLPLTVEWEKAKSQRKAWGSMINNG